MRQSQVPQFFNIGYQGKQVQRNCTAPVYSICCVNYKSFTKVNISRYQRPASVTFVSRHPTTLRLPNYSYTKTVNTYSDEPRDQAVERLSSVNSLAQFNSLHKESRRCRDKTRNWTSSEKQSCCSKLHIVAIDTFERKVGHVFIVVIPGNFLVFLSWKANGKKNISNTATAI